MIMLLKLKENTGDVNGVVSRGKTLPRAMSPSFHQSDLCAVVESLASIYQGEFP